MKKTTGVLERDLRYHRRSANKAERANERFRRRDTSSHIDNQRRRPNRSQGYGNISRILNFSQDPPSASSSVNRDQIPLRERSDNSQQMLAFQQPLQATGTDAARVKKEPTLAGAGINVSGEVKQGDISDYKTRTRQQIETLVSESFMGMKDEGMFKYAVPFNVPTSLIFRSSMVTDFSGPKALSIASFPHYTGEASLWSVMLPMLVKQNPIPGGFGTQDYIRDFVNLIAHALVDNFTGADIAAILMYNSYLIDERKRYEYLTDALNDLNEDMVLKLVFYLMYRIFSLDPGFDDPSIMGDALKGQLFDGTASKQTIRDELILRGDVASNRLLRSDERRICFAIITKMYATVLGKIGTSIESIHATIGDVASVASGVNDSAEQATNDGIDAAIEFIVRSQSSFTIGLSFMRAFFPPAQMILDADVASGAHLLLMRQREAILHVYCPAFVACMSTIRFNPTAYFYSFFKLENRERLFAYHLLSREAFSVIYDENNTYLSNAMVDSGKFHMTDIGLKRIEDEQAGKVLTVAAKKRGAQNVDQKETSSQLSVLDVTISDESKVEVNKYPTDFRSLHDPFTSGEKKSEGPQYKVATHSIINLSNPDSITSISDYKRILDSLITPFKKEFDTNQSFKNTHHAKLSMTLIRKWMSIMKAKFRLADLKLDEYNGGIQDSALKMPLNTDWNTFYNKVSLMRAKPDLRG
jgi:hypothetical protein